MPRSPLRTQAAIGLLVAAYGAVAAIHRAYGLDWLAAVAPESSDLGLWAAVHLVAAGIGLALAGWPAGGAKATATSDAVDAADEERVASLVRLVPVLCAAMLLALPGATLLQTIFGVDWGLDALLATTPATPQHPHPGRMAPSTCLALMATGAALFFALQLTRQERQGGEGTAARIGLTISTALVTGLAALGLLGHFLGLQQLYGFGAFNRTLLPTAAPLLLLSVGLWRRLRQPSPRDASRQASYMERRIIYRALATLTVVALGAGLVGFVVMRETFERTIIDDAGDSARTHALALSNTLQTSLWFPRLIATRPGVKDGFSKTLDAATHDQGMEHLRNLIATFISPEVIGVRFLSTDGQTLAQAGVLLADTVRASHDLVDDSAQAQLMWSEGYVLRTTVPVRQGEKQLGMVLTEQHLHLFDEVLLALRQVNESSDAIVCSRRGETAACDASRFYGKPFSVPLFDAQGKPSFPVTLALQGQTGALLVRDLRDEPVAAGFAPVGRSGLGLVVKTDVHTIYTPIRQRFNLAALLMMAFVLVGTWALRSRVRPLLAALVAEQQRTQKILDTSSDAFISLDPSGRVADWNAEASRLFGWTKAEARGRELAELVIPERFRAMHRQGFEHFAQTGEGAVVNRRTELIGLHQSGREIPIELSISAMRSEQGFAANAFVRDIRERQEAQQRLAQSEHRLHEVIDNIPAMVGYFDRHEKCIYANDLGRRIKGLNRGQEQSLTLREAIGDDSYLLHEPHLPTVLSGRYASFEGCVMRDGVETHFQAHLIPETSPAGEVTGFYTMSFDITALRRAQIEQERSESQLRAIADNLPVMISYIDRDVHLRFANRTFEQWTGIPIARAMGRKLPDVIGPELYQQRAGPLQQCLTGERVEFEVDSVALGVRRVLHTLYIPDMSSIGQVLGVYALTTDVTTERESERKLAALALNDPLTGLANRRHFEELLSEALFRAKRAHTGLALMFLDVDHFKSINDGHGHAAGDAVLIEFAKRLQRSVRVTDTVARLSGDEFVVILDNVRSADEANRVAEKVLSSVREPMKLYGYWLNVTTSIGVAYAGPTSQATPSELLAQADAALYSAKHSGRNTLRGVPHNQTAA